MAGMNGNELWGNLQGLFQEKTGLKALLEILLEAAMAAEQEAHLQAERFERTDQRRGHRNGTKPRTLKTRVGELKLEVPQTRGCEPYHPSMFGRWQRSEQALLATCAEMYFQGVSTRRAHEVLQALGGLEMSAAQVSRIAMAIDEKLAVFRDRRLDIEAYEYLVVDARYEKVRRNGHGVSQAVLVVAGITASGWREILDWRVGDSESEATWGELFRSLKDRGVHGVAMVVSDAHAGIKAAVKRHFQGVAWQRCRVHFKRELLRKVSWKVARALMADVRTVFAPEERVECLRRAEEMACQWEARSPAVARMLRDDFESCLTVCGLPQEHRRRLNSTNLLERVMREIKARTQLVGIFPNAESCDRLVGARLLELHERWQLEPARYLAMETLERPEHREVLDPVTTG